MGELVADGLAWCRDGQIAWASPRLAELCGCREPAELEGRAPGALVDLVDPAPAPERPAVLRRLVRADGAERLVEVRRAALDDGELWSFRDTSHVHAVEEELLRAGRELHATKRELAAARERVRRESAEREELLTVVSHELRTPVTVISGYNKLLLSEQVGPLSDEQRRFLHESTKSCQRLNTFIGNLLEASRQVGDDGVLEVCEASLGPTIDGVVAFLKPLLEEHDLSISVELHPEATLARFDPVRIERVLTNLLANAIKYAAVGGRIRIETRPGKDEVVELAVSDDGPGVDPSDRERIFLPYVRSGQARGAGGLGLGLAICKRLVEAHGGAIWVEEAAPRGGSRFVFTLPVALRDADEEGRA